MTIAVITPTLPERRDLLVNAVHSVASQTLLPDWHLIGYDPERIGGATIRNRLCYDTSAEWIAPLDDDDYFLPNHLEALAAASDDADVVYSHCEVQGREGWNPGGPCDPELLQSGNYIPVTSLIRRSLFLALDGWRTREKSARGFSDWDFWLRAIAVGARFVQVPEVTWTYRLHDGSQTVLWEKELACRR